MSEITEKDINTTTENTQSVNLTDLLGAMLNNWLWIAISVFVCLSIALFSILRAQPVYQRNAEIVIKDSSKGKSISNEMNAFADMGFMSTKSNILDEINKLKSPDVMEEVVRRLELDKTYQSPGTFHKNVLYGTNLPIKVFIPDLLEQESASAEVTVYDDNTYTVSKLKRGKDKFDFEQPERVPLDSAVMTPIGLVIVKKTEYFRPVSETTNPEESEKVTENLYYFSKAPLWAVTNSYVKKLNISQQDEKSNTIQISIDNRSAQCAEDIILSVIGVYNEIWIENRNQIAVSTSNFINERLRSLEGELGNVDQNIASYQSQTLTPDVKHAAAMYMEENQTANAEILNLNNQLQMTRYMRSFINDANNRNQVLPANTGIQNSSIEKQIADFNNILLERNRYSAANIDHPHVRDLEMQITEMRNAILSAIDNQEKALQTQITNLQATKNKTTAQIAANPTQAKYLLSVERQQKVKEALYLFLLQKREENELSQAFTAYNTQIIAYPFGPREPVAPRKMRILMVAFLLGLALPIGVLYCRFMFDTRIRGRKDLKHISAPFLGEIPKLITKAKKGESEAEAAHKRTFVVKQGNRNVINEAFRVLRTNVSFVAKNQEGANTIMVTSFNAGSGKSFVGMNLGLSLAIRKNKVLIIDGDLRHASTSEAVGSPKMGLTDYLVDKVADIKDVIATTSESEYLDILPVGTIPPNPTELLELAKFGDMVNELRDKYDYIFVDCPPIEMMADAQIVNQYVDRTIFVVRAGLLDRSMLPELERLYQSKKYHNIGIVLNATQTSGINRYGYGYGYGYGYRYGYGYHNKGYGYYSKGYHHNDEE